MRGAGLLGLGLLALWAFSRRSSAAPAGGRGTDMGSSTARGILSRFRDLFNANPGPFPPGALAEYARVESGGRPRSIASGGTGFREAGLFGATVAEDGHDEVSRHNVDPLDARGAVYGVQAAAARIMDRLSEWFSTVGYTAPATAADWITFMRLSRSVGHRGLLNIMTKAKRTTAPTENPGEALRAWHASNQHVGLGVQTASKVKLRVQRALDFPAVAAAVEPFAGLQPLAPRAADVPTKPAGLYALVDSAIRAGRRVA